MFDSDAENEPAADGVGPTPFLVAARAEVAAMAQDVPARDPLVVVSNFYLPPDPFELGIGEPTTDPHADCHEEP